MYIYDIKFGILQVRENEISLRKWFGGTAHLRNTVSIPFTSNSTKISYILWFHWHLNSPMKSQLWSIAGPKKSLSLWSIAGPKKSYRDPTRLTLRIDGDSTRVTFFTEWLHSSTVNDSSQSHFYKFSKHLIDKPSSFAHKDISFFLRWWSKFLFWLCLLAVLWCILSIKCSTKYGGRAESLLFLLRGWGARSAPFFRVSLRAVKSHNLINTHVFLRLYR